MHLATGNLSHQIEHHLFPTFPRPLPGDRGMRCARSARRRPAVHDRPVVEAGRRSLVEDVPPRAAPRLPTAADTPAVIIERRKTPCRRLSRGYRL